MIAASSVGIFLIATLYVAFQSMREWAKARFHRGKPGRSRRPANDPPLAGGANRPLTLASTTASSLRSGAHPLMNEVLIKRAYDPPSSGDGFRVLVDRLWPRGLKREEAKIGLWLKDVAPSDELRKWFGHDPEKWQDFANRYRAELARNPALDNLLAATRQHKRVTLLFAAKDSEHNNAVVLQAVCKKRTARSGPTAPGGAA